MCDERKAIRLEKIWCFENKRGFSFVAESPSLSASQTPKQRKRHSPSRKAPHTAGFGGRAASPFPEQGRFCAGKTPSSPIAKCNSTFRGDFPDKPQLTGRFRKITGKCRGRDPKMRVISVGNGRIPYFRNREFLKAEKGNGVRKQGKFRQVSGSRKPQRHPLFFPIQRNVRRHELRQCHASRLTAFQDDFDNCRRQERELNALPDHQACPSELKVWSRPSSLDLPV
jgi:hypothetical protein